MLSRRALVTGLGAAATLSVADGLARGSPPGSRVSPNVRLLEWDLGEQPWGPARAVIVAPTWGGEAGRFPLLVALHGRGEALKAPEDAAMGWPRDYAMVRAIDRLRAPPLRSEDYEGFVEPSRMAEQNAALAARPFAGLVVVCPSMPDVRPATSGDVGSYASFLLGTLLPRVRSETPALPSAEATGIDGVSLGGIVALRIGLANATAFGAVGGIQPAVQDGQDAEWVALAKAARAKRPGLRLRLLTSHEDFFRDEVTGISRAWRAAGVAHDFADVPGPHDYAFNRGPGSIELLLWHDRALARA
jgi:iron(III)-salmochelin esterase